MYASLVILSVMYTWYAGVAYAKNNIKSPALLCRSRMHSVPGFPHDVIVRPSITPFRKAL